MDRPFLYRYTFQKLNHPYFVSVKANGFAGAYLGPFSHFDLAITVHKTGRYAFLRHATCFHYTCGFEQLDQRNKVFAFAQIEFDCLHKRLFSSGIE